MSFIDGEEKLLGLQTNYPFEVYKPNAQKSIYEMCCNAYVTPVLDPTHSFLFGVDLAKDDPHTDLHINVKRRNIKFNFNN